MKNEETVWVRNKMRKEAYRAKIWKWTKKILFLLLILYIVFLHNRIALVDEFRSIDIQTIIQMLDAMQDRIIELEEIVADLRRLS